MADDKKKRGKLPWPSEAPKKELTAGKTDDFEKDESLQDQLEFLDTQTPLPPEFQKLNPNARLVGLALAQNKKHKQIAQFVGISTRQVARWATDPRCLRFKDYVVNRLTNNVMKMAQDHAFEFMATIIELNRTADKDSTRLSAAVEGLNRLLGKPTEKHEHKHVTFRDVLDTLRSRTEANLPAQSDPQIPQTSKDIKH